MKVNPSVSCAWCDLDQKLGNAVTQNRLIRIEFTWQYLVLAIDVMCCELYWGWANRMNQANLIPIFKEWMPDAVIWDGVSAHRNKAMGEVGFERIFLIPYSP